MAQVDSQLGTGLPGLDRMLRGLIPGDNIVWQVDSVDQYVPFVAPYVQLARRRGYHLTYFRFARHEPLLTADDGVEVVELRPEDGFEQFIADVHAVIQRNGRGGYYVFDCLSDLAVDWYSDQMLGNFFMLTCPYLYDVEAIAYFALLRGHHSVHATEAISSTTQIFLDLYHHRGQVYLHPLKVQQRYSPTMYMLHVQQGDDFRAVTHSAVISEIMNSTAATVPLGSSNATMGIWHRTFLQAQQVLQSARAGQAPPQTVREWFGRLMRMAVSRDPRVLELLERYMGLEDVLAIGRRMIGTGLIGGKSVGMLLARAILEHEDPRWSRLLEAHDSFYIGSDVFYTFLVRNGIWWIRQQQRDPANFLQGAERARQRMLTGTFPEFITRQFEALLEYFGQSPIIVRSSSLLEDNFGNSFAGKYESVFCANQGPYHKRLEDFLTAVRTIYASAMSEKALTYRHQRGMLDKDEQMALLVQRVSGQMYGKLYFPQIAGVGFSFNPYVWSSDIDPSAGMLRLVFGLGTRAVDRADDDYTRVVALNAPSRRVESSTDQVRQYSQRRVDVLDLEANQLLSKSFAEVASQDGELPLEIFASRDDQLLRQAAERNIEGVFPWVLTFDNLFASTSFVKDMREMLATLQRAYDYPVDVEFTANFFSADDYRVNLVQCRPFQVKGGGATVEPPADLTRARTILEARGAVIGQSRVVSLDRLVCVMPSVYGQLPIADRYQIARLIGRLSHLSASQRPANVLLAGPGRWGTTTPSLGVPVVFGDINTVSAVCEIVAMRDDLVPDVSLGTHFFNELVEMDMLYLALFPHQEGNFLNQALLEQAPNRLLSLLDEAGPWQHVVRVVDAVDLGGRVILNANAIDQRVICYVE